MITGPEIRTIRQRLGRTQRQLGDQLGVPQVTVARWESGASIPQHPEMLRLALERLADGAQETRG